MVLATSQQEFSDADFRVVDNGDQSKKVALDVSGVATATTRTLTIPNASGTIALTSDLTSGYQPLDSDLTAIAALTTTTFGRALLTAADRGTFLTLGGVLTDLGTIADDTAVSVNLGTQTEGATCILQLNTNISIIFSSRTAATSTGCLLVAKTTTSYTVLMNNFSSFYNGTTGIDGQMSIGAHTSGVLSIENRIGVAINGYLFVLKKSG